MYIATYTRFFTINYFICLYTYDTYFLTFFPGTWYCCLYAVLLLMITNSHSKDAARSQHPIQNFIYDDQAISQIYFRVYIYDETIHPSPITENIFSPRVQQQILVLTGSVKM